MSDETETERPWVTKIDPWVALYVHQPELDAAINASDRVYRNSETGRLIKVRAKRRANPSNTFGEFIVEVSGAHANADGKAHRRIDAAPDDMELTAFQIAPTHVCTFQAGVTAEVFAARLESARLTVAAQTERAVVAEEFAAQLLA